MVYKWTNFLRSAWRSPCLLCGDLCANGEDLGLCAGCRDDLPRPGLQCDVCGEPQGTAGICGRCLRRPPPFTRIRAPWLYGPPLDSLILRLKTPAGLAPARTLGGLLGDWLAAEEAFLPDLIVPVPLHRSRMRQRGFNQAGLLAKHVSARLDVPWRADVLRKRRESADQHRLDRRQRLRNLTDCFDCRPLPAGCQVALVDDVVTTGATAWAAALALRRAGAGQVRVWALARTP